jgi:hypothetical protein
MKKTFNQREMELGGQTLPYLFPWTDRAEICFLYFLGRENQLVAH